MQNDPVHERNWLVECRRAVWSGADAVPAELVRRCSLLAARFVLLTIDACCGCTFECYAWHANVDLLYDEPTNAMHRAVGFTDWNLMLDSAGGPSHDRGFGCNAPLMSDTVRTSLRTCTLFDPACPTSRATTATRLAG